jgi:hypothetical protein
MMFLDTKLLRSSLIFNFFYFSLSEGGTSPRFLIIDDGWQQIESKPKDADCAVQEGAQ